MHEYFFQNPKHLFTLNSFLWNVSCFTLRTTKVFYLKESKCVQQTSEFWIFRISSWKLCCWQNSETADTPNKIRVLLFCTWKVCELTAWPRWGINAIHIWGTRQSAVNLPHPETPPSPPPVSSLSQALAWPSGTLSDICHSATWQEGMEPVQSPGL